MTISFSKNEYFNYIKTNSIVEIVYTDKLTNIYNKTEKSLYASLFSKLTCWCPGTYLVLKLISFKTVKADKIKIRRFKLVY